MIHLITRRNVTKAALVAGTGAAVAGYATEKPDTVQNKLRGIVSVKDFDAIGDGVASDGAALRRAFSEPSTGSTVLVKAGIYLLDQDGANTWCLHISKRLHIVWEPGVILKADTNGTRSVLRLSACITSEGAPIIDGDYKTNHAVEVVIGASGVEFFQWEGKNVTQIYNASFSAAVFSVVSETGITFKNCYAHDAVSQPNSVIGDVAGTARGFHYYGAAKNYGNNYVTNCVVDNIRNTNGLSGAYEDEDGIVCQMANSFTFITGNKLTNCMKRGIKGESSSSIESNTVISTRTESDNVPATNLRMYSGISVYGESSFVRNNIIGSGTDFSLSSGGSFSYLIEVGISGKTRSNISITENKLSIGASSSARSVEFLRLWGGLTSLHISDNTIRVGFDTTVNQTWGLRSDFDHASVYATVNISGNYITNTSSPMQLRGGFSGTISGNILSSFNGGNGGIAVDPSETSLRPTNVTLNGNVGLNTNDFTIRVNDIAAVGICVLNTLSSSTTGAAVSIPASLRVQQDSAGFGAISSGAVCYLSAPPSTGTWHRGDKVFNADPRDAAPVVLWLCQYGGTPGTWRAVSWIVTSGATVSRPTLTASDAGVTYLDTTLATGGKPIWWNGTAWKDATGSTA